MSPADHPDFDPNEEPGQRGPRMTFQRAETIEPTKPMWDWNRWLCVGSLHLLVGRQGGGKTTFASWVVGQLSTGRGFPDDLESRSPIICAMLSLEEPADRLVARLRATGADLSRIVILGDVEDFDDEDRPFRRPWRLPQDCTVLERLLVDEKIGMAVVDGLGYSVAGSSQDYATIGSALSSLSGVAERTECSILGLTHPPKGTSDPVTAAIGSTAWTAVSRIVWVLGTDPDDESGSRRVVRVAKSNFRMPDDGLSFTIGEDAQYECGFVTGLAASTVTAEELVAASAPAGERTEREEARELVRSILKSGPMETSQLLKKTQAAGFSDRTVSRARSDLKVKARARHDPNSGQMTGWFVELPTTTPATLPLDPKGSVGAVGVVVTTSSFVEDELSRTPSAPTAPPLALVEPSLDDSIFESGEP